ncbi:interferon-induced protein 44-like isoform X1 [Ruditapes philippinarum]|uniref:interferon-induced protein 44-like isoform X1 n=1 Tax=Ruditapes philippinarum TaxID=129788 RepID=UPI00295A9DCF|nr:interferon-induced protein 44-like isoform X1 [Ruditapes philippinarum]
MTSYKNDGDCVPVQSMPNGVFIPSNGQMNGHFIYAGDQICIREMPQQWRPTKWSREHLDCMKDDLIRFTPKEDPSVTRTRILMIGLVGAGKSSFYNTIDSVFRNRITQRATCGSAEESLTKNYNTYAIKDQSGTDMNFCLCDTRGMEELNGLHHDDCKYLLDGHIKDHYEFSTEHSVSWWYYNGTPSANDRVHCIAFVIDATSVDVLSEMDLNKIRTFQKLAKERGILQTVVLTKIDNLCKDVKKDISLACSSTNVEEAVQKIADLLGLPRNNVFPVKNYENETELDDKISILALAALKQMLFFTEDALQKKKEEAEHEIWLKQPCNIL